MSARIHVVAGAREFSDESWPHEIVAATLDLGTGRVARARSHYSRDAGLDREIDTEAGVLLLLIDGAPCGGFGRLHPLGIEASELALDAIRQAVRARPLVGEGEREAWLVAVLEEASFRAYGTGWGTLHATLAAALFVGEEVWVAHAGDVVASTVGASEGSAVVERTRDHSLRNLMEAQGQHAEIAAMGDWVENVLTGAFGFVRGNPPEARRLELSAGEVLLLAPRKLQREVVGGHLPTELERKDLTRWLEAVLAQGKALQASRAGLLLVKRVSQ